MTYKIVTFSYINNGMINTISVTYNIYNEDGSIHRSNLRKSIKVDEANVDLVAAFENINNFILENI